MDVKELKKHCAELNKHLEKDAQIDLDLDDESLLAEFVTALSELQEADEAIANKLSDGLVEFYNELAAEMLAGGEEDGEGEGEEGSEGEGGEETPDPEPKKAPKKAPAAKAEKPAAKKEKAPAAKKEKAPKPPKEPKEPKEPKPRKSSKRTLLTEEHLNAGPLLKEQFGKIEPLYPLHQGGGTNFGKDEQPKDELGAVIGSGTQQINEFLLSKKGATLTEIAEALGTKETRVRNHIYALKRSGVVFDDASKGVYKVKSIPANYHKKG